MDNSYFLIIDAGTSTIALSLLDYEGMEVKRVSAPAPVITRSGKHSEMDMWELWELIVSLCGKLNKESGNRFSALKSVGITAQGDGCWILDCNKRPCTRAILWNDTRAGNLPAGLSEEANLLCERQNVTSLFPGASPMILRWLKDYDREVYDRASYILHCKDWILFCLSNQICTDVTDASTAVFDIFEKQYRFDLLALLGIEEKAACYPPVRESGDIAGTVSPEASALTGIPEGVTLICGALDVAATAHGLGLRHVNDRATIIGTTLANLVYLDEKAARSESRREGSILCSCRDGMFFRQMSAQNGTVNFSWARNSLANHMSYSEIDKALSLIPEQTDDPLYFPFLKGERAPFKEATIRAGFIGIGTEHGSMQLMKAVYEGVAFSLLDCHLVLRKDFQLNPESVQELRLAGGGSESSYLCQLISNITGLTVSRVAKAELGITGMFMLLRDDKFRSESKEFFYPDESKREHFRKRFSDYQRWRDRMLTYYRFEVSK